MRLFLAVLIPDEVRQAVAEKSRQLKELKGIRWISSHSLHITLKFLGETAPDQIPEIKKLMELCGGDNKRMELTLRSGGVFPDKRHAKILWTGISGDVEPLKKLANDVSSLVESLGYPKEEREFSAHVTLARNKSAAMTEIVQFCTLFQEFSSPNFMVKEFHLMKSELNSEGSRYESLGAFPLVPH